MFQVIDILFRDSDYSFKNFSRGLFYICIQRKDLNILMINSKNVNGFQTLSTANTLKVKRFQVNKISKKMFTLYIKKQTPIKNFI